MNTSKAAPLVTKAHITYKDSVKRAVLIITTAAFTALLLTYSPIVAKSVSRSLQVCAKKLIPSLFPFMVSAQLFFTLGASDVITKIFGRSFEAIFGISGAGASAFLLGAVCGLPLGGKCALELYKSGRLTSSECERLTAMSTNAGLGFTVAGVGGALLGNIRLGFAVYFVQIIAQITVGILLKPHRDIRSIAPVTDKTPYTPFLSAVSSAISTSAVGIVAVCGYVTFFGVICDLTINICDIYGASEITRLTIISLTELTCACEEISTHLNSIEPAIRNFAYLSLFFSFGFSGLSVHMQLSSIASETDVRIKTIILMKLLCGLLSVIIGSLTCLIFNIK